MRVIVKGIETYLFTTLPKLFQSIILCSYHLPSDWKVATMWWSWDSFPEIQHYLIKHCARLAFFVNRPCEQRVPPMPSISKWQIIGQIIKPTDNWLTTSSEGGMQEKWKYVKFNKIRVAAFLVVPAPICCERVHFGLVQSLHLVGM